MGSELDDEIDKAEPTLEDLGLGDESDLNAGNLSVISPEMQPRLIRFLAENPNALGDLEKSGFDPTILAPEHVQAYRFIQQYQRRSFTGSTPLLDTVFMNFPENGYDTTEIYDGDTAGGLATAILDDCRHAAVEGLIEQWQGSPERFHADPTLYDTWLPKFNSILRRFSNTKNVIMTLSDVVPDLVDRYRNVQKGLATGIPIPFPFLNKALMGYQQGEMTTVAGRTGTGKSWFSMLSVDAAVEFLENPPQKLIDTKGEAWFRDTFGDTIVFSSHEMDERQTYQRIAALRTRLPYGKIRDATLDPKQARVYANFLKAERAGGPYTRRMVFVPPESAYSPERLVAIAREYNSRLIIADSMYLMADNNSDDKYAERDSDRLKKLWTAAKLLTINPKWRHHCIATTQQNRESGRSTKTIAGSDGIGWGSNNVIFLSQNRRRKARKEIAMELVKARDAPTGDVYRYTWDWGNTLWNEIGPETERGGGTAAGGGKRF